MTTRVRQWAVAAGIGAGVFLAAGAAFRLRFQDAGFAPDEAALRALVLVFMLELLHLPLASAALLECPGAGVRGLLGASAGSLMAGLVFAGAGGVPLVGVVWAQALVTVFALWMLAWGRIPLALGCRAGAARAATALLTLGLVSVPFWTQAALAGLPPSGWKTAAHHVLTWLSPLVLLTQAFAEIDLGTVGRMYEILQGPVLPYPPHIGAAVLAYGVLAGLGVLVSGARNDDAARGRTASAPAPPA